MYDAVGHRLCLWRTHRNQRGQQRPARCGAFLHFPSFSVFNLQQPVLRRLRKCVVSPPPSSSSSCRTLGVRTCVRTMLGVRVCDDMLLNVCFLVKKLSSSECLAVYTSKETMETSCYKLNASSLSWGHR